MDRTKGRGHYCYGEMTNRKKRRNIIYRTSEIPGLNTTILVDIDLLFMFLKTRSYLFIMLPLEAKSNPYVFIGMISQLCRWVFPGS